MKTTHDSIFVFIVMSCFSIFKGVSQNTNLNYLVELKTSISTNTTLPFWMASNNFGAFPNKGNTSINVSLFYIGFNTSRLASYEKNSNL